MSRLDWVIECNEQRVGTCAIICLIFHHAYDERSYNNSPHIWLNEIKPKVGKKVRLRIIREALAEEIWEKLHVEPMA